MIGAAADPSPAHLFLAIRARRAAMRFTSGCPHPFHPWVPPPKEGRPRAAAAPIAASAFGQPDRRANPSVVDPDIIWSHSSPRTAMRASRGSPQVPARRLMSWRCSVGGYVRSAWIGPFEPRRTAGSWPCVGVYLPNGPGLVDRACRSPTCSQSRQRPIGASAAVVSRMMRASASGISQCGMWPTPSNT